MADRAAQLPGDIDAVDLVRALGCVSVAQHSATDPAVELAERAAREALFEAGAEPVGLPVFLGASKGAMHALTAACSRVQRSQYFPDAELAVAMGPHGYLAHHLSKRLGIGEVHCTVAACASSLTALHAARNFLLRQDDAGPREALVVTSEAALLPAFIHSYRRLGVLSPLTPDQYRGQPLDHRRNGFMLAEVGAAVVLRKVDESDAGQIELIDTAIATEAFDIVRSSPRMDALRRVAGQLLANRRIDMLHPHATGTQEHDAAELSAYLSPLAASQNLPPTLYASKGALGHTLGSAGLTSLILAVLIARTNQCLPMPWLQTPIINHAHFTLPTSGASSKPLTTHAIFAAGFGGHVAGAIIQRK